MGRKSKKIKWKKMPIEEESSGPVKIENNRVNTALIDPNITNDNMNNANYVQQDSNLQQRPNKPGDLTQSSLDSNQYLHYTNDSGNFFYYGNDGECVYTVPVVPLTVVPSGQCSSKSNSSTSSITGSGERKPLNNSRMLIQPLLLNNITTTSECTYFYGLTYPTRCSYNNRQCRGNSSVRGNYRGGYHNLNGYERTHPPETRYRPRGELGDRGRPSYACDSSNYHSVNSECFWTPRPLPESAYRGRRKNTLTNNHYSSKQDDDGWLHTTTPTYSSLKSPNNPTVPSISAPAFVPGAENSYPWTTIASSQANHKCNQASTSQVHNQAEQHIVKTTSETLQPILIDPNRKKRSTMSCETNSLSSTVSKNEPEVHLVSNGDQLTEAIGGLTLDNPPPAPSDHATSPPDQPTGIVINTDLGLTDSKEGDSCSDDEKKSTSSVSSESDNFLSSKEQKAQQASTVLFCESEAKTLVKQKCSENSLHPSSQVASTIVIAPSPGIITTQPTTKTPFEIIHSDFKPPKLELYSKSRQRSGGSPANFQSVSEATKSKIDPLNVSQYYQICTELDDTDDCEDRDFSTDGAKDEIIIYETRSRPGDWEEVETVGHQYERVNEPGVSGDHIYVNKLSLAHEFIEAQKPPAPPFPIYTAQIDSAVLPSYEEASRQFELGRIRSHTSESRLRGASRLLPKPIVILGKTEPNFSCLCCAIM